MGKTGLIHHVFHNMQENNDVKCFYVDLYQTDSLELLVKKLADTIPGFKVDVEPGQAEYSLSEIIDNNGEYQLYDRFFGVWLVENVR